MRFRGCWSIKGGESKDSQSQILEEGKSLFYENLQSVCKEKGITTTAVVNSIGIGNGAASRWKKGSSPTSRIVIELADYLGVTTDRLLIGKQDNTNITLLKNNKGNYIMDKHTIELTTVKAKLKTCILDILHYKNDPKTMDKQIKHYSEKTNIALEILKEYVDFSLERIPSTFLYAYDYEKLMNATGHGDAKFLE